MKHTDNAIKKYKPKLKNTSKQKEKWYEHLISSYKNGNNVQQLIGTKKEDTRAKRSSYD